MAQPDSHWQGAIFFIQQLHTKQSFKFSLQSSQAVVLLFGDTQWWRQSTPQWGPSCIQTMTCIYMYGDSVWHHPRSFLKQLLLSDMMKPLFWPMSTPTAAMVYTVTVWRVDLIREKRMQPLPQSKSLSNHCRCSIWLFCLTDGNHFQNPEKGHQKLEGFQGGGSVSLKRRANKPLACISFKWYYP